MNVVIIEDEHLTAERISTLLSQIDPRIKILTVMDTIKKAIAWFQKQAEADLVFMDIQLADGLSFDIFDSIAIDVPVIFITAYQEYAIKAFKVNSVDYLLKPVSEEDLRGALDKYRRYFKQEIGLPNISGDLLLNIRKMIGKPFKSRFMIRVGEHIKSLDVNQILYIYSLLKGTYIHSDDNRNYVVDYSIGQMEEMLDPLLFHRINRKYLITHRAIDDLHTLSSSKLKVKLIHADDEEIYISRDRLPAFKKWLDQ